MNGIQVTGVILAVLAGLFALGSSMMGAFTIEGSSGYGGPGGSIHMDFRQTAWIGLGVAAVGVLLVFVGREQAPPPTK